MVLTSCYQEEENNQIRLCVDFRELNKQIVKDYYPLPFIDQTLDQLAGREIYSFMDCFAGYNQMAIAEEDKLKTTFITVFGTFAYHMMAFGLCNAPGSWQRTADKTFGDISPEELKVFIDDLGAATVRERQLIILRKCFERCRQFCIALNPRKCVFRVPYGLLLGHVVSSGGIAIDPKKIKVIIAMSPPCTPKEVHSFLSSMGYY